MKGHVYAEGEKDLKPIRVVRQVFEFFKKHCDPRKINDNFVFSIGEGDTHLVFHCKATVGGNYYFAITFEKEYEFPEDRTKVFFWITSKIIWDQIQDISTEEDFELIWSMPPKFKQVEPAKYMYEGPWEQGIAMLQSYGFVWCSEMEEKLVDTVRD